MRRRGPDAHNMEVMNGLAFHHFLLHITGEMCPQPFIEGNVAVVYNGELYGLPFRRSDGENLLPLYKAYGSDMVRFLDGEYAIAIYDFSLKKALFITDPFGTKPLWINGLSCASYESALNGGAPLPPNTWLEVSFDGSDTRTGEVFQFDFTNQFKKNFSDWDDAFAEAIRKRSMPAGLFLPLSSGYDSGRLPVSCSARKFLSGAFLSQERSISQCLLSGFGSRAVQS